jgi:DNA adenine methylase
MNSTPLRYPGGKSIFTDFFGSYIKSNNILNPIYIEPYCGGSGAAINLLIENKVEKIWLNDASYSIYSFWYSIKYLGEQFLEKIESTEVNLKQWNIQKEILSSKWNKTNSESDLFINGFATFFLNRSNRSGILNAGPIGGLSEESQLNANYKINARFNKPNLISKVQNIVNRKEDLIVSNFDALKLLDELENKSDEFKSNSFVYLDPPYFKQGSGLYLNYYRPEDHRIISEYLSKEFLWKWLLSYDNVEEIRRLYKDFPQYTFYLNYSVQEAKLGSELLIHSRNSVLPESLIIKQIKHQNKRIELVRV